MCPSSHACHKMLAPYLPLQVKAAALSAHSIAYPQIRQFLTFEMPIHVWLPTTHVGRCGHQSVGIRHLRRLQLLAPYGSNTEFLSDLIASHGIMQHARLDKSCASSTKVLKYRHKKVDVYQTLAT